MKTLISLRPEHMLKLFTIAICTAAMTSNAVAFEGRISAMIIQGSETTRLFYTVGTNALRVEVAASNRPNPVDILYRNSGELKLLFPNNRSYVRLKPAAENSSMPPSFPQMAGGLPPGVGPQSPPSGAPAMPDLTPPQGIGPTNLPGMPAMPAPPAGLPSGIGPQAQSSTKPIAPAMPAMPNMPGAGGMPSMPAMPMVPMEQMELKATGEKTSLLGFACEKFEIKQRGETMEIWATDQLLPFQNYVRNQPHHFGPRMIEEQWAELLTSKKLFPLRASLHFDNGVERFRFEVKSVTPGKLTDEDANLLQPPINYFEIQPLPF